MCFFWSFFQAPNKQIFVMTMVFIPSPKSLRFPHIEGAPKTDMDELAAGHLDQWSRKRPLAVSSSVVEGKKCVSPDTTPTKNIWKMMILVSPCY